MANPTAAEMREAVAILTERIGHGKLHERLVRLNAFVSRRKPPSPDVLADRLYSLTSGLRRQVPATLAFHSVWAEVLGEQISEDADKQLEALAERINGALTEDQHAVRDGKGDELAAALGEYEQILVTAMGPRAARMEMLLKAVSPVAALLRERPLAEADTPAEAEAPAKAGAPAKAPTKSRPRATSS